MNLSRATGRDPIPLDGTDESVPRDLTGFGAISISLDGTNKMYCTLGFPFGNYCNFDFLENICKLLLLISTVLAPAWAIPVV